MIGSSMEGLYYLCSRCLKGKNTFSNFDVFGSCCNCFSTTSVNSEGFRSPTHSYHLSSNVNTFTHNNKNDSSVVFDKSYATDLNSIVSRVVEVCYQKGLLVVHTGRESIKIGPPLTIEDGAIHEGISVMRESILQIISKELPTKSSGIE